MVHDVLMLGVLQLRVQRGDDLISLHEDLLEASIEVVAVEELRRSEFSPGQVFDSRLQSIEIAGLSRDDCLEVQHLLSTVLSLQFDDEVFQLLDAVDELLCIENSHASGVAAVDRLLSLQDGVALSVDPLVLRKKIRDTFS